MTSSKAIDFMIEERTGSIFIGESVSI